MNEVGLKLSAFFLACGLGILIAFLINGSTPTLRGWSYLFADTEFKTKSCQVKLIDRDGQTFWMSCLQWEKHQEFVLEHSD